MNLICVGQSFLLQLTHLTYAIWRIDGGHHGGVDDMHHGGIDSRPRTGYEDLYLEDGSAVR
jgi:hypothetical protein